MPPRRKPTPEQLSLEDAIRQSPIYAEVRRVVDLALKDALAERPRLTPSAQKDTLGDMEGPLTTTRGAAISAGRTKNPTRFQELLQARGLSLPEWHETLPQKTRPSLDVAKSWVKRGKSGRPVPHAWAAKLAADFDDPTLLLPESWPHGIR